MCPLAFAAAVVSGPQPEAAALVTSVAVEVGADPNALLLGLIQHPFVATVVVGIIWPLVQASFDKPWWTRRRRVILLAVASAVLSLGIWLLGVYPWAWEMIATQMSMILGIAWSTYQILSAIRINDVRLLDWVGILTPGGEDLPSAARHRGELKKE